MIPGESAPSGFPPVEAPAAADRRRRRWDGVDIPRRVAVLIMVVTLLGAVFSFLQTAASNRAADAARRGDGAAVRAQGEAAQAAAMISAQWRIWVLAAEDGQIALSLEGAADPNIAALAQAAGAGFLALAPFVDFDLFGEAGSEWQGLYARAWSAPYREVELQKAYAAERDGWGGKGKDYVAVVTVLAVSLFLIGLSRTPVAASSGPLLVGAGAGLAALTALLGLLVFLRPVAAPSPEAIDAFVEGQVLFESASGADGLRRAEEAFTTAITVRADYSAALFWRGLTRSALDLSRPEGPAGSEGARDDFARVASLDPLNAVAWNNLAAARFWLGDLDGALGAIGTSLELDPGDLLANLNRAFFLAVAGDAAAYEAQMGRVRGVLEGGEVSAVTADLLLSQALYLLDVAERHRPQYSAAIEQTRADLQALRASVP
ncbi:MAG: hypothetical protein MUE66_02425 [Acidimicrobiia bacterium]|nr:hypothetical protein [Acidimicrobiia bacterium]